MMSSVFLLKDQVSRVLKWTAAAAAVAGVLSEVFNLTRLLPLVNHCSPLLLEQGRGQLTVVVAL